MTEAGPPTPDEQEPSSADVIPTGGRRWSKRHVAANAVSFLVAAAVGVACVGGLIWSICGHLGRS